MAKRITMSILEQYDRANRTSKIREIEMRIDTWCEVIGHLAYTMQFWRDVRLYGVGEALRYLRGITPPERVGNVSKLSEEIAEILVPLA